MNSLPQLPQTSRARTSRLPGANSRSSTKSSAPALAIRIQTECAPASVPEDPEVVALRAQVETLETKLALYHRREQLDREYAACLTSDALRSVVAPIVQHVCNEFGITVQEFWHGRKIEARAIPRHIARTLAREHFATWPLKTLGLAFRCDHTAICWSSTFVSDRSAIDAAFAARLAKLRAGLHLPK